MLLLNHLLLILGASIENISVYAPNEEAPVVNKDEFYDSINIIYTSAHKYDIKIIIGDLNAKVGKEEYVIPIEGNHSLRGTTNDNVSHLINFATEYNRIKSTKFAWKNRNNQIDHYCSMEAALGTRIFKYNQQIKLKSNYLLLTVTKLEKRERESQYHIQLSNRFQDSIFWKLVKVNKDQKRHIIKRSIIEVAKKCLK